MQSLLKPVQASNTAAATSEIRRRVEECRTSAQKCIDTVQTVTKNIITSGAESADSTGSVRRFQEKIQAVEKSLSGIVQRKELTVRFCRGPKYCGYKSFDF